MALFQCNNPECSVKGAYIFDRDIPTCDKCGSEPPITGVATTVHFCFYHKDGTLKGLFNKSITVACGTGNSADPWNCMTQLPYLVTCPRCKDTEFYKKFWMNDPHDIYSYYRNPNLIKEEHKT